MLVNFYVNRGTIFNGKILNEQNKQNIQKLREKLNDIEINGVPINNNCVCKLPPDSTATLKTKDNKYSIGKSSLGNNLVIREKLDNDEYHKVIISPQNNVSEILYDDEWVDIKKDSESAKRINSQLAKILQIFL